MKLNPALRLYFIARDDKYPPSYYPEECFDLTDIDIEQLDNNALVQLYEKINKDKSKRWRGFKLKIKGMISRNKNNLH